MLKYFVKLTQDLMIAGLSIGFIYAYVKNNFRKIGKNILHAVIGASFIAAIVLAFFIQTTNKINQGYVNLTMYCIFVGAFLLWGIANIPLLRNKIRIISEIATYVTGSLMIFSIIFYIFPTIFLYPFNFDLSGNTIFSTEFIFRIAGMLFGALLCYLAALSAGKCLASLNQNKALIFTLCALFVNALLYSGRAIQVLRTRLIIKSSPLTFNIIKITLNYYKDFIFASMAVALILVILVILNNREVTEEYSNKAQLRKIKARMRRMRRWAVLFIVCAVIAVVNLTVIDAYNNREPASAPVEDPILEGESVLVPFEMVEDGHLHRFGYTTPDGILVKFIVVMKPGSSTYGVGLDACDICGDAGYYERNDQIVCRRCGVVMNTNTIGFRGGCNPIVFEYTVHDGLIDIPVSELIANQNEFK
ncbi:MAG: DUF2318 domain-containing protein [Clostridiales bacterium]|nr:DUF2318 domain-containing protein [Clostridiales bacterium]